VVIGDARNFLRIVLKECRPSSGPVGGNLGLHVRARTAALVGGTFGGRTTAWVKRGHWTGFLAALRELELTGRGLASVQAMTASRFRLGILPSARTKGIVAEGWIGRRSATSLGIALDRVTFSIDLDRGELSALRARFEAIARCR
jgi:hypothetical protein